ncbi:MAG: ion transporter [Bacteroidota bacterium]
MDKPSSKEKTKKNPTWREKVYKIIFDADTFYGRLFDELLLIIIIASILVVMLESVAQIREEYSKTFYWTEWIITIIFTIEYLLRIFSHPKPFKYITSFFGIIDLMSILPTYFIYLIPVIQPLIVIRSIRLLRIYRILKLYRYIKAGNVLLLALRASFSKIMIFMVFMLVIVLLLGSIMYVIEGGENGFYSIPLSIYWAIITLSTVGYGDIVPVTAVGKFIASFIMLLGYSIIAIPTGIVSSELTRTHSDKSKMILCKTCQRSGNDKDSVYCKHCGSML